MSTERPTTVFLLSPASVTGVRAKQLVSPRARFDAAVLFRSPGGVPVAEAFAFMSALYFRGKIAYARRFASDDDGIRVIVPGFGLVPPGWPLDRAKMRRLRRVPVDPRRRAYRGPLERDLRLLAERLGPDGRAVLLGSVATGKYLDVLLPILGARLFFPGEFAGLGDMSRGSRMLRAALSGVELDYAALDAPRHHPTRATLRRD
ncbi:MAG TPA: hypothetical protein VMS56_08895 [Thermoanaerobaculia bacterium]|nr:hypothetical protein [Thermoanaerobaculia bacterium]